MITLKRAYDSASRTDGKRFLVERLWPSGVSKAELRVDADTADRFVEKLLGVTVTQTQVDRGARFVAGVVERAGAEGLARLWKSAKELPTPAEVDAPGLWLARIDLPD